MQDVQVYRNALGEAGVVSFDFTGNGRKRVAAYPTSKGMCEHTLGDRRDEDGGVSAGYLK